MPSLKAKTTALLLGSLLLLLSETNALEHPLSELPPKTQEFDLSDLKQFSAEQKKAWKEYQKSMNQAFSEAKSYSESESNRALVNIAWERFLSTFEANNPFSQEDERLRLEVNYLVNSSGEDQHPQNKIGKAPRLEKPTGIDSPSEEISAQRDVDSTHQQFDGEPLLPYFSHLEFTNAAQTSKYSAVLESLETGRSLESAIQTSIDLMAMELEETNLFKLKINHASLLIISNLPHQARTLLDQLSLAITTSEILLEDRVAVLRQLATAYYRIQEYSSSYNLLDLTQHLAQRLHGPFSTMQIPILEEMTKADRMLGNMNRADSHQIFTKQLVVIAPEEESLRLVPTLLRLGHYFSERGNEIPLPDSFRRKRNQLFNLSEESILMAISILEKEYAPDDLRLVAPLRQLASTYYSQFITRQKAEVALEQIVKVVESNHSASLTDRALAQIELGDFKTIVSGKRPELHYLRAWKLLQKTDDTRSTAEKLLGKVVLLYPLEPEILLLSRQPSNVPEGQPIFVELSFSVSKKGRASNIKILNRNVPNSTVRRVKHRIKNSKFRPRVVDGELTDTNRVLFTQNFVVH